MPRRIVNLLPALAFLATFGVFFVDKNREAKTVLESGRGLLTIAVIVGGYALIAFVLRRFVLGTWVAPIALAAIVFGLAAWIVRPYYVDKTVNRELVTGPVMDVTSETSPGTASATETAPDPTAPSAGPVRTAGGDFVGIDHDASGTVSLIETPDGAVIVRFENFDIEGVPDPRVYLVEGEDVQDAGGIDLGGLPGNQGDILDFEVPAGSGAGPEWTLLVWCRAFAVPVANATLV